MSTNRKDNNIYIVPSLPMEVFVHQPTMLFLLSLFMLSFAWSESFVGVTYGTFGTLPPYNQTANFLTSTYIQKVRAISVDEEIGPRMAEKKVNVVGGTGGGAANHFVINFAGEPWRADDWVQRYIAPSSSNVEMFTVGEDVLGSGDQQCIDDLVPAMEVFQNALNKANLSRIKVTTLHTTAVLAAHEPPSNASFKPEFAKVMNPLLKFLREHKSPFMVTNHPYYAFQENPTPENLAFCLFQKNSGRTDPVTGNKYWNMFDWKLDAYRNALNGYQFEDVEIMVGETGWPTWGDDREVGASMENARIYNSNLVHHLRTSGGTPLMPNTEVSAYIHSLYDENYKEGGRGSDKWWGIVNSKDFTWKYSMGLMKYFYKKN